MSWEKIRKILARLHQKTSDGVFGFLLVAFFVSGVMCMLCMLASVVMSLFDPHRTEAAVQSNVISRSGFASRPLRTMTFRADVNLDPTTKSAVVMAADDIERSSCGLLKIKVIWNYVKNEDMLGALLSGNSVLQNITLDEVSRSLGASHVGDVLGMTRVAQNPHWSPAWIFLVGERLDGDEQLAEWTVAHEMCHAAGMKHVEDGLMHSTAPLFLGLNKRKPSWSRYDAVEFCSIYGCDPDVVKDCGGHSYQQGVNVVVPEAYDQ